MIEPRLWLHAAKAVPVGGSDKIQHKGCGDRPSLFVRNDEDKYWCYCHRCRDTGHVSKTNPRVRVKVPSKTGWYPKQIVPLVEELVKDPYKFRDSLSYNHLHPYTSLLTYGVDTGRIYFPDESGSYLGLDVTGKANARWYSPTGSYLLASLKGGNLLVNKSLVDYLERVKSGASAVYLHKDSASDKAKSLILGHEFTSLYCSGIGRKLASDLKLLIGE